MYGCDSWTIKKAEHWRTDTFELWCWRRLFRVSWTARKSNQSILKEINPEYSLEGRMLKLQYFGHLMWRADSFEKTLILGKTEGRRRRGTEDEMVGLYHWSVDMSVRKLQGTVKDGSLACCSSWGRKESDMPESLNNNRNFLSVTCAFILITQNVFLIIGYGWKS